MFFVGGRSCLPSEVSKLPGTTSFRRTIFGSKATRNGTVNRSLAFSTLRVTVIAAPSWPSACGGEKLTRAGAVGDAGCGAAGGGVGGAAVGGGVVATGGAAGGGAVAGGA